MSGGWLRPAVFGAMDGLVTNVSLIAGVGGGGGSQHAILLTGLAGLAAGALAADPVHTTRSPEMIRAASLIAAKPPDPSRREDPCSERLSSGGPWSGALPSGALVTSSPILVISKERAIRAAR